jgi:rhamnosyltransferase
MTADSQKNTITVLMSTYNGEKYLTEQIESIICQKDVNVTLLVRDDGSTDKTLTILRQYQEKGALTFYTGENLGPQRSFLHLLQHAPQSDYYAFADQDDVWLEDKLNSGIKAICSHDSQPAIYACQTQMTNQSLEKIPTPPLHPCCTFGESLVYAYASGCTMVFNNALRTIITSYQPSFIDMHDWWIISIATAMKAHVVFDHNAHILYRQHSRNVKGLNDTKFKEWKQRIQRLLHKQQIRYHSALELYKGYYTLFPQESKDLIDLFIMSKKSFKHRLRLLMDSRYKCGDKKTWVLFKLSVLLNTY